MFRIPYRVAAAGACEDGGVGGRGRAGEGFVAEGLEAEPFFQAGAAEGVQAVEAGEGVVEEVGADLLFFGSRC